MDELKFKVYCNRHSRELNYRIKKTSKGWHISHIAINGDCMPDGSPYFYTNFNQDDMNYPSHFGMYLEHLWEQIDTQEINYEVAQTMLQDLADWVSSCEQNEPKWKGYNI